MAKQVADQLRSILSPHSQLNVVLNSPEKDSGKKSLLTVFNDDITPNPKSVSFFSRPTDFKLKSFPQVRFRVFPEPGPSGRSIAFKHFLGLVSPRLFVFVLDLSPNAKEPQNSIEELARLCRDLKQQGTNPEEVLVVLTKDEMPRNKERDESVRSLTAAEGIRLAYFTTDKRHLDRYNVQASNVVQALLHQAAKQQGSGSSESATVRPERVPHDKTAIDLPTDPSERKSLEKKSPRGPPPNDERREEPIDDKRRPPDAADTAAVLRGAPPAEPQPRRNSAAGGVNGEPRAAQAEQPRTPRDDRPTVADGELRRVELIDDMQRRLDRAEATRLELEADHKKQVETLAADHERKEEAWLSKEKALRTDLAQAQASAEESSRSELATQAALDRLSNAEKVHLQKISELEQQLADLRRQAQTVTGERDTALALAEERLREITEQRGTIDEQRRTIDEQRRTIDELNASLEAERKRVQELEQQLGAAQATIGEQETSVATLKSTLQQRDDDVAHVTDDFAKIASRFDQLEAESAQQADDNKRREEETEARRRAYAPLADEIKAKFVPDANVKAPPEAAPALKQVLKSVGDAAVVVINTGSRCEPEERPDSLLPAVRQLLELINTWRSYFFPPKPKADVAPPKVFNMKTSGELAIPKMKPATVWLMKHASTPEYVKATDRVAAAFAERGVQLDYLEVPIVAGAPQIRPEHQDVGNARFALYFFKYLGTNAGRPGFNELARILHAIAPRSSNNAILVFFHPHAAVTNEQPPAEVSFTDDTPAGGPKQITIPYPSGINLNKNKAERMAANILLAGADFADMKHLVDLLSKTFPPGWMRSE